MSRSAHWNALLKSISVYVLGTWIAAAASAQTTFFVNGSCGNDAWTGLEQVCQAPDGPKKTIQAGINVARTGDTVMVADGTYTGFPGNKWLWFPFERNSTLRSENGPENCIIDLENDGMAFFFVADEPPEALVDGFTITNGNDATAGAIHFHHNSRVVIANCIFTGNTSQGGGAISCDNDSNPTIINCLITGNTATFNGGAILTWDQSTPTFINCTITGNTAAWNGGALFLDGFRGTGPTFINCTISDNTAGREGGGIFAGGFESGATVTNSIIWGNSGDQIAGPGDLAVTFSDVEGGFAGVGNINADPRFVDPVSDNYRLLPGSPAIDAADNDAVPLGITTDADGNARFMNDQNTPDTGNAFCLNVDMGAYEFAGVTLCMQLPTPGIAGEDNTFSVTGATPGRRSFFVFGLRRGSTNIPGCPPGLVVEIRNPQVFASALADQNGDARVTVLVPDSASGRTIFLQVVEKSTCQLSNLVQHRFD